MASRGVALSLAALWLLPQLASLHGAAAESLVPAIFVFGDSTVDVGNNNYLANCSVLCKADHARYGIDYSDSAPTGRFSNGHNLADQLAQLLGFSSGSPPAFLSLPDERRIPQMSSTGINFASGGSGLLVRTGLNVCGEVVPMAEQVVNFTSLVRLWGSQDPKASADLISRSLVFISVGSNDLFEYCSLAPDDPARNDTLFLQALIDSYTGYVKGLYEAGARKFSVVSPSLVGCCPSQRTAANKFNDIDGFGCFGRANNLSSQLYPMVDSMLQGLSAQLPGMNYSLGDSIGMAKWVFSHANATNFTVLDAACCGREDYAQGVCNSTATLCTNRGNHMFWDRFHPTEAASGVTAGQLFATNGSFVHPISVQQLVAPPPRVRRGARARRTA
ncbi:hypothetical protein ACP4OV_011321 [Aristida adscensionis]